MSGGKGQSAASMADMFKTMIGKRQIKPQDAINQMENMLELNPKMFGGLGSGKDQAAFWNQIYKRMLGV